MAFSQWFLEAKFECLRKCNLTYFAFSILTIFFHVLSTYLSNLKCVILCKTWIIYSYTAVARLPWHVLDFHLSGQWGRDFPSHWREENTRKTLIHYSKFSARLWHGMAIVRFGVKSITRFQIWNPLWNSVWRLLPTQHSSSFKSAFIWVTLHQDNRCTDYYKPPFTWLYYGLYYQNTEGIYNICLIILDIMDKISQVPG